MHNNLFWRQATCHICFERGMDRKVICHKCFDKLTGSSGDWTLWFDNVEIGDIVFGFKVKTMQEKDLIRAFGALLATKTISIDDPKRPFI